MGDITELLTIDQFMAEEKSKNKIFLELWNPLFNKYEVLITRNLLESMGFGDIEYKKNLKNFILFLRVHDISYEQIDSENDKINNYECIIKNESDTGKKWLLLSIDSFIRANKLLKNEEVLYNFYELQNTCSRYQYKKDISELTGKFKKKIQLNVEENNKLTEKYKHFINNVNAKQKDGCIYIATTKTYAKLNNFKIGKAKDPISRLVDFNVSRNSQDPYFICYCEYVYESLKVEKLIHSLLKDFRDGKQEIFIIHYDYLLKLITPVIQNINKPFDNFNILLRNEFTSMFNLEAIIPEQKYTSNLEERLYEILDTCINTNNLQLTRRELINELHLDFANKHNVWATIRNILGWTKSKKPIVYKNVKLFIKY